MHGQNILLARTISACAGLVLLTLPAIRSYAADETPPEPLPTTFTIVGLFCPERENDLKDAFARIPEVKLVSVDFQTAEAKLSYDLATLLPEMNAKKRKEITPQKITERLDNLLKTATNHSMSLRLPSGTPKDKLIPVEIAVGILDCKGCCLAVYEAVAKLDGVERATVARKPGQLTAWIDPAKTDRAALETALTAARVPLIPPSKPKE